MDPIKDYEISSGMSHSEILAGRNKVLSARSITIAVQDSASVPDIGLSPFIHQSDGVYIYSSHLADHVRNMLQKKCASFMISVDESACDNIWARHRLKFFGTVEEIDRDDPNFLFICDELAAVHGNTMALIKDFTDFHMMRITPVSGVLVLGFAKAFCVEGFNFDIVAHLSKT